MVAINEKQQVGERQATRPIHWMERFCLIRETIGFPHHLTMLTTYPIEAIPTTAFLTQRIGELQEHCPALYSRVIDRKTRTPKWQVGEHSWDPSILLDDILFEGEWDEAEIMRREMARFANVDMEEGVYWQVRRYLPSAGSGSGTQSGVGYIALSTSHVLTDGMAALHLSEALLSATPPTTFEPALSGYLDPKEIKAGFRQIASAVWGEVIYPGLPRTLRAILPGPPACWPLGDPFSSGNLPTNYGAEYSYLPIPFPLSARVQEVVKKKGASFHMAIKVALLFALWRTLRPDGRRSMLLKGLTPRDERYRPSHPQVTGVFPSIGTMHASIGPECDFWHLVSSWGVRLVNPREKQKWKREIGTLKYVPDSPNFKSTDPRRCTGWEDFWLNRLETRGPRAVEASLELSNLTRTKLPPGASDFAWVQPPFPVGAAVQGSLVGHEGGLRLVICWRDGFCITEQQIKRLEEIFVGVLERLVEGGKSTAAELTAS